MFKRLVQGIGKTRDQLADGLKSLVGRGGRPLDEATLETLEETLLAADVGWTTTEAVVQRLRRQRGEAETPTQVIRDELVAALAGAETEDDAARTGRPHVVLVVGVNGAGKTTSIGKLAAREKASGRKVMLAAGDTFRAAAVEQLKTWGERLGVPVVAQETGSDAASVLYDALAAARARGVDVLYADTAGRLQNKAGLMDELRKIVRVMKKLDPDAPHETLLVLDATTGQNAVSQLKEFREAVAIDALVLTKLDGTAKGGIVFRLVQEFGVPIRFVGVGESAEDLQPFDPRSFVDALLDVSAH